MRYKEFELFGVKVYKNGEWINTKYFKKLSEAIEYAKDRGSAGYTYKYISADKYGCEIDVL